MSAAVRWACVLGSKRTKSSEPSYAGAPNPPIPRPARYPDALPPRHRTPTLRTFKSYDRPFLLCVWDHLLRSTVSFHFSAFSTYLDRFNLVLCYLSYQSSVSLTHFVSYVRFHETFPHHPMTLKDRFYCSH